jgi:hypothetical protein
MSSTKCEMISRSTGTSTVHSITHQGREGNGAFARHSVQGTLHRLACCIIILIITVGVLVWTTTSTLIRIY